MHGAIFIMRAREAISLFAQKPGATGEENRPAR
jgi:hypothetical protein